MKDSLFDVYQFHESEKLFWDVLEDKYMAEEASSKKYLVSNFNAFPIVYQFQELQSMYANMKIHDICLDEIFIVSSKSDKLPPSWRDVRHAIKHKKEDISLIELGQHFVVESSIRGHEGQKDPNPNVDTINIEEGKPSQGGKRKKSFKGNTSKSKPVENRCWECGIPGHL